MSEEIIEKYKLRYISPLKHMSILIKAIEAIEFYSYKANYMEIMPNARPIQLDGGEKARDFLEKINATHKA